MTASTVKSENITNIESSPISELKRKVGQSNIVIDQKAVLTTSIDEINDAILFCPIPSNAVITSLKIFNDDLDADGSPTLAVNVGLYYSGIGPGQQAAGKVSGDVVSATCIATAITTLQAANVLGVEIRFEAADIVSIKKEAWDLGGLSSDPGGLFYIGLKASAAAATADAGDIVLVIEYI